VQLQYRPSSTFASIWGSHERAVLHLVTLAGLDEHDRLREPLLLGAGEPDLPRARLLGSTTFVSAAYVAVLHLELLLAETRIGLRVLQLPGLFVPSDASALGRFVLDQVRKIAETKT